MDPPEHGAARVLPLVVNSVRCRSVRRGRGKDWFSQRHSQGEGSGQSRFSQEEQGEVVRWRFISWIRAPWPVLEEIPGPSRFPNIDFIKQSNTRTYEKVTKCVRVSVNMRRVCVCVYVSGVCKFIGVHCDSRRGGWLCPTPRLSHGI